MPRPKTGQTKVRHIRSGQVWDDALAKARAEGRTLTDVINTYLHRYVTAPARKREDETR